MSKHQGLEKYVFVFFTHCHEKEQMSVVAVILNRNHDNWLVKLFLFSKTLVWLVALLLQLLLRRSPVHWVQ